MFSLEGREPLDLDVTVGRQPRNGCLDHYTAIVKYGFMWYHKYTFFTEGRIQTSQPFYERSSHPFLPVAAYHGHDPRCNACVSQRSSIRPGGSLSHPARCGQINTNFLPPYLMKHDSKSLAAGFLAAIFIVCVAAFAGRTLAHGGPSQADYAALSQIKANQKVIAKNRDAYTAFTHAKADNEKQIGILGKDGYTVDWAKMSLEPYSFQ